MNIYFFFWSATVWHKNVFLVHAYHQSSVAWKIGNIYQWA